MLAQGFEAEKARVEAANEAFLQTIRELSEEGRFIVVHGGNSPFANSLLEILAGMGAQHQQRLDRQNFYRIPLER